jgi:hypothetical protein
LLAGLASGYVAIAVQAAAGLLLVPFLLSRHGVGLEGYGVIATLQAVAAMITVAFDGHRQESSRRLAGWIIAADRNGVAGLLVFTLLATAVVVGLAAMLSVPLIRWLELASEEYATALLLALTCIVLEQFCYLLESSLHAARRSWIANALGAGDALLRALLVVALFTIRGASVDGFFIAALAGLSGKAVLLWFTCRSSIGRVARPLTQVLREEGAHFIRSLPLALNGVAPYVVFRLSIIAGNKYLGAQQAGVLAIILVTLRTYLNQAIFSALRPMLISRLAISELQDMNSAARQRFADYILVYQALVYVVAIAAVCATPVWLPLWLGESLRPFVPHFMAAVAIYFLEIAYGVPYYCLVAHNHARSLAVLNGAVAAAVAGVLFGASRLGLPMTAYVYAVFAYLGIYVLLVRRDFRRLLHFDTRHMDTELALGTVAIIVGVWAMLGRDTSIAEVLGVSMLAAVAFLAACHFAVMPWNRVARLIRPQATPRHYAPAGSFNDREGEGR